MTRSVGAAHVVAGPADLGALVLPRGFGKEPIDGFPAVRSPQLQRPGSVKVVDQGGEFGSFAVGNFVVAKAPQAPDAVSTEPGADNVMQQPRQRRAGHKQDLTGSRLRHGAAEHADPPFQPAGDARVAVHPGDVPLYPSMRWALVPPTAEPQQDLDSKDGQIVPATPRGRARHDAPLPAAPRTAASILKLGLDRNVQLPAMVLERERSALHAIQS